MKRICSPSEQILFLKTSLTNQEGDKHFFAGIISPESISFPLNPLYTGRLFHCYMLDESIFHFRDVRSMLSLLFYFLWKSS